jgi:hypothetical protein
LRLLKFLNTSVGREAWSRSLLHVF